VAPPPADRRLGIRALTATAQSNDQH
jgi:hypothetical protein